MVSQINQFEVYSIILDPTLGREIKKQRPCVVISPNELNHSLGTALICPLTSKGYEAPFRVQTRFKGKNGLAILDQIRCVDKSRLKTHMGTLDKKTTNKIRSVLQEMFQ